MKEIFLVEDHDKYAIFAPLKGLIMEIEKNEKEKVASFLSQSPRPFKDLCKLFPEIEENRLLSRTIENTDLSATKNEFLPHVAVLFTTLDCHLRCVYCYANAGTSKVNMNWKVAKATIDFIIHNAVAKGSNESVLHFHGGGEPTWNWEVFKTALNYFREQSRDRGLTSRLSLATNGMLPKGKVDWLAKQMKVVQVSLDGMDELQDRQRPTVVGGKSSSTVFRTIDILLAKGVEVIIHSVITDWSISRIPEIVHFLAKRFPVVKTIHLEPACRCGRGLISDQHFPSPELFVKGFIEAEQIVKPSGIELFYSGAGPWLSEYHRSFCGVVAPNFVVTPEGLVTACHEVVELNHEFAPYFIYGRLDHKTNNFELNYEKIKKLQGYVQVVNQDPKCQECFARFYCAGDCLARSLNSKGEESVSSNPRCPINRELARHYIFNEILCQEKGVGL